MGQGRARRLDSFGTGTRIVEQNLIPIRYRAGIAQLVEHNLAKVGVASSNLVSRSRFAAWKINVNSPLKPRSSGVFCRRGGLWRLTGPNCYIAQTRRPDGRVVMQRPAKPCTPVRFRLWPPHSTREGPGPGGEIGRRSGLKIRGPQGHAGSTPAPGTKQHSVDILYSGLPHHPAAMEKVYADALSGPQPAVGVHLVVVPDGNRAAVMERYAVMAVARSLGVRGTVGVGENRVDAAA